ncbi:fasciclin domain-containing protein [Pelagibacterium montanilacus]|uniref:fasciclin domain-containing protein n=1 Tax=Pelagibacterium montanilacus TaxID=2185280 RepID=UPI000F8D8554|nr:fasciclin domain-containing protein [Pelagibacterium montanilacus]
MLNFSSALATGVSALVIVASAGAAGAQENPMVGGAPMSPEMNIIENAVNSADHTTLVAAVEAAGLVDTLQGEGPFTVFAPTNAAFDALPEGTVDTLLMEENLEMLQTVLTCHVMEGTALASDIMGMAADGGGTFTIDTIGGCQFEVAVDGEMVTITDEQGGTANVTIADVIQSNGVIHVIDAVLLPAM